VKDPKAIGTNSTLSITSPIVFEVITAPSNDRARSGPYTFFGGHETSWGPKKEVHAYFSNFKVSTTKL
jgi:hypothetical protein